MNEQSFNLNIQVAKILGWRVIHSSASELFQSSYYLTSPSAGAVGHREFELDDAWKYLPFNWAENESEALELFGMINTKAMNDLRSEVLLGHSPFDDERYWYLEDTAHCVWASGYYSIGYAVCNAFIKMHKELAKEHENV